MDSSVWVNFFRFKQSSEALHLDGLLQAKAVQGCAPVRAEVLSGARTERERLHLREWFKAIPMLMAPDNLWEQVEEVRFSLARHGYQVSMIDLIIASTAAHHHTPLWTLDEDFTVIHRVLSFPRYLPET